MDIKIQKSNLNTLNENKYSLIKIVKAILALQPLFPVPVYFSVLVGRPPLWLSLAIAVLPLGVRLLYTRRLFRRTPFDIPILLFMAGSLLGLAVAPDKGVAAEALASTLASILVYYGITDNAGAGRKYWLWTGGIVCAITMVLSLWFLWESDRRVLPFNKWAFDLFATLPHTSGPVLQLHTIAALLAVVIPPLFTLAFFKNNSGIRLPAVVLWAFFTLVLFLSASGSGWLAFLVSLAFILVVWHKWLAIVLVPLGGWLGWAAVMVYDRIEWLQATFGNGSLMGRLELWQNTLTLLKGKAAFFGLGPGGWKEVYNGTFGGTDIHVHNSYIQLYGDAGILGFIAMFLATVILVRLAVKMLRSNRENSGYWITAGLIAAILAGAVFAVFDTTMTITYVTNTGYIYLGLPLLWIFGAMVVATRNNPSAEGQAFSLKH